MKHLYTLTLLALLLALPLRAQTPDLSKRDVVTGLKVPVEITWGPDDWLWFAEKSGRVGRIDPSTGEIRTIHQVPDLWETNEAGLLGMAVYPRPQDEPYVFLAYTYYEQQEVRLKLVRFRYDGTALRDSTTIFHRVGMNAYSVGGRLTVTPDRKILMTVGDADQTTYAQAPWFLGGKVLRMNLDGSAPGDNWMPQAPTPLNLIWSSGHHDPRGIVSAGGTVWAVEQGKDSVDEINLIQRGGNYGYPRVIGNCDMAEEQKPCSDSGVATPRRLWRNQIFPSGLDYYSNAAIPEFNGSLLMTTLDERDLRQLTISGGSITGEIIHYDDEFGRIRDLAIAPDGRIFLATSNRDEKGIGSNYPGSDKIIELGANRALALLGTPVITGDSSRTFHAGRSVTATFSAMNFGANNVFTLEISDANGSFAAARAIGQLSGPDGGSITGTVPCDPNGGVGYRFRVVASTPSATKVDATTGGYRIIAAPASVISPSTDVTICPGDSIVLRARRGLENRWSNGTVGDSLVVRDAGSFFVVAVSDGCPSYSDTVTVTLSPLPQPSIVLLGTSTLDAGSGFAAHQWFRNDTLIEGAFSRSIQVSESGTYTVRVRSRDGCWNMSEPFVYELPTGVEGEAAIARALRLYPHPTRDRLSIELGAVAGGSLEIVVTDLAGRESLRLVDETTHGAYRRDLDVSALAPGAYLLRVRCGEEVWNGRFVRE